MSQKTTALNPVTDSPSSHTKLWMLKIDYHASDAGHQSLNLILSVNIQCLNSKKSSLWEIIDHHDPLIICEVKHGCTPIY